jgi:hypothetical protein
MAIKIVDTYRRKVALVTEEYAGRVIEVRAFKAERNMSDTLDDRSDWRQVECTEALVWLGPRNLDHMGRDLGPLCARLQFTWIDCSNHFAWRGEPIKTPLVDAVLEKGTGSREMWKAFFSWTLAVAEEDLRQQEVRRAITAKADAKHAVAKARADKHAEKSAAAKRAAEAQLAASPAKGTRVKAGTIEGTVGWRGVQMYRGKWNARIGVKQGTEMFWFNAVDVVTA